MKYNEDPSMKEFGVSVSGELTRVGARVLDPPSLLYGNGALAKPARGVWRASQFIEPKSLNNKKWAMLSLDRNTRANELNNLEQLLRKGGTVLK